MNFFKSKKSKKPIKPPEPRAMDEIQKVHGELCARAGMVQYRMSIDKKDLDQLNAALESINREAAERQKLDAEAKAKESQAEAPKSEEQEVK